MEMAEAGRLDVEDDPDVEAAFSRYRDQLETESDLRYEIVRVVRDWDKSLREASRYLSLVHSAALAGPDRTPAGGSFLPEPQKQPQQCLTLETIAEKALLRLAESGPIYLHLRARIPSGQFWRYYDMFRAQCSQVAYLACFSHWLLQTVKAPQQPVSEMLPPLLLDQDGIRRLSGGTECQLEEYLFGICSMSNELARFAVNCVARQEAHLLPRIQAFVGHLYSGMRLCNFKNDALRKRFDSLKYDVKRLEEIAYDLAVRQRE